MWAVIKLLPELLQFARSMLQRFTVAETKEMLRKNAEEVRRIDKQHDEDPRGTTVDFFSDDGVRDANDTE